MGLSLTFVVAAAVCWTAYRWYLSRQLWEALRREDPGRVRALVLRGTLYDPVENGGGDTALMLAEESGDLSFVQEVLRRGARPDAEDPKGGTALQYAASQDRAAIVAVLLEAGADPNHQDGTGYTPLMGAAASGNVEAVRLLLRHGAGVQLKDRDGETALSYARKCRKPDAARVLSSLKRPARVPPLRVRVPADR